MSDKAAKPKVQTQPRIVAVPDEPAEESQQEAGTQAVDIEEMFQRRLEQERRKPQSAPSPVPASIIDLIPKPWRPYVAILLLIMGSGSVSWLANLRTIWELPAAVSELQTKQGKQGEQLDKQGEQLDRIEALLKEPASRPRY